MSVVDPIYYEAVVNSSVTEVIRKVDIYESDSVTPWALDIKTIGGNISVDQTRTERRTLDLTLRDDDGQFRITPDGFWYDKIIKVQRGVRTLEGDHLSPLGSFMIDSTNRANFPDTLAVTGRDFTKKLIVDKFVVPTSFAANQALETIIKAIALNGGIDKFILPNSGVTITREFFFDKGTSRWDAINELATAHGFEVYFDPNEYMVMAEIQDPLTSPVTFTFKTGDDGVITGFNKRTNDARLFNHIGVSSESSDTVPVYAEATNTEPTSPTRIARIGRRFWSYSSAFIETQAQAQSVANKFLKTMALEQFDVSIDSLVVPWLDAGSIVRFEDPDPSPTDPSEFLLSSFSIPLGLGKMTSNCKRVTVVG